MKFLARIFFILLLLSADRVCCAQNLTERKDSSSFNCIYKISFLEQTLEYGEKIGWDTIPMYSAFTGEIIDDTLLWDTLLAIRTYREKISECKMFDESSETEVWVTSCDGSKKFEIKKMIFTIEGTHGDMFDVILNGGGLDCMKLCSEMNKPYKVGKDIFWFGNRVIFDYIYLEEVKEPIFLSYFNTAEKIRGIVILRK